MKHLFLMIFFTTFLFSHEVLSIKQNETPYVLGSYLDYCIDAKNNLSVDEIKKQTFSKHQYDIPSFGFLASPHWFKLQYKYDKNMQDNKWWLCIDYPLLDHVNIYIYDKNDNLILHKKSGDLEEKSLIDIKQSHLLFLLPSESLEIYTVYIKVQTSSSMLVPMRIASNESLIKNTHLHQTLAGIYYGILLVLLFYNAITFLYTKEKIYLLYVMFVFSYSLWQLSFDGIGSLYLWPDSYWMRDKGTVFFIYTSIFVQLLFSQNLLKSKQNIPKYDKNVIQPLVYISIMGIIASMFLPYKYTIIAGALLSVITPTILFSAGLMVIKKDYYSIRLYVLGWGIFLIGTILFALSKFNLISGYVAMKYAQQIASAIEMILLSAALAERFNRLQDEYTTKLKNHNKNLHMAVSKILKQEREKDEILISQSRLASMGEMIEQIAHQWRQPLNELGLLNQDLYFKKKLGNLTDDDFDKIHDNIDSNIQYMSNTIDDFRNYYKSDKEKETFALDESITDILSIVGTTLEYAKIKVVLKLEENIYIDSLKHELQQVFLIIINNAKDALIINEIEDKKIVLEVFCDNEFAYVNIVDNAGGVAENIKNKIFDPYFSTKFKSQGTGIGLYMAKIIIEKNMQGNLNVFNKEEGACFCIKLPLK
nr:sensor histidine kinase [uncultured Sulfurimonas sp.]